MSNRKETVIHVWNHNLLTASIWYAVLTQRINISDSRAVAGYAECPFTTCTFRVMHVSMHKMVYQKVSLMHVWSYNSPILACMQL